MIIKSYCRITNHSIIVDGERLPELEKFMMGHNVGEDLDNVYAQLKVDYYNYQNMDDYSKLGFITAELLMRHNGYDVEQEKPDMGLFIYSRSGCLGADYTLVRVMDGLTVNERAYERVIPNAICSSIACRHKISGETGIFLSDGFIYEQFFRTGHGLFETEPGLNTLLAGYVECYGGYVSSLLCLLKRPIDNLITDYDLREERFCIEMLRIY
jgi:hypothetical protein